MRFATLVFLWIVSIYITSCQDLASEEEIINNSQAASKAIYPTGNQGFTEDVVRNIKEMDRSSIPDSTFKLYCEATLNEDGLIENVEVLHNFLAERPTNDLIQAIKRTKKWIPAKDFEDKKIKVKMLLPIAFQSNQYAQQLDDNIPCDDIFIEQKNILGDFKGNFVLLIPLEGCSGCVNYCIDKITQLNGSGEYSGLMKELIFSAVTTNRYNQQQINIELKQKEVDTSIFWVDQKTILGHYLLDKFQPLLIQKNDKGEVFCKVLNAQNVENSFAKLVKDLEREKVLYDLKKKKTKENED